MNRPWQRIPCMRLSISGPLVIDWRFPGEEVALWEEFHKRHSPWAALIVSDEIKALGNFEDHQAVADALIAQRPMMKRPTV